MPSNRCCRGASPSARTGVDPHLRLEPAARSSGWKPLPARVKKVDPTGFSATAISCVENLGANTWQDTTELVTVRLGDVAHPKVVAHLCSNRFHDTLAWSQASRYLNCVMRGSGWPFFEKTALGSVDRPGAPGIARRPAGPLAILWGLGRKRRNADRVRMRGNQRRIKGQRRHCAPRVQAQFAKADAPFEVRRERERRRFCRPLSP